MTPYPCPSWRPFKFDPTNPFLSLNEEIIHDQVTAVGTFVEKQTYPTRRFKNLSPLRVKHAGSDHEQRQALSTTSTAIEFDESDHETRIQTTTQQPHKQSITTTYELIMTGHDHVMAEEPIRTSSAIPAREATQLSTKHRYYLISGLGMRTFKNYALDADEWSTQDETDQMNPFRPKSQKLVGPRREGLRSMSRRRKRGYTQIEDSITTRFICTQNVH